MKVLHVTNYDRLGGAGIAAFRLHQALRKEGIDSRMLVRTKGSSDPFVSEVTLPKARSLWSKAFPRRLAVRGRGWLGVKITRLLGMEGCSLNIFPTGLHKILNASDADVIHLHWVNNEMISIKEIAKIKKPLVWTLHDCWPFLGAEHHSDADYWKTGDGGQKSEDRGQTSEICSQKEAPSSPTRSEAGGTTATTKGRGNPQSSGLKSKASLFIFRKKQRAWKHLNVQFVAPSSWMAEEVRQSRLFADASVKVIPNVLDTNVFKPMDKMECRKLFNFPLDKKLILFGAYNPMDPNKGSDLLEQALIAMPKELRGNTDLVVFGAEGEDHIAGLKTHWMGVVSSEEEMTELYNAADVVCVPSRRESFGQTASESLACGVPVVAFRTTGLMDIVDHKENGYLADPFDAGDLAQGLQWVLSSRNLSGELTDDVYEELSKKSREKTLSCFDAEIVAVRYQFLLKEILRAV